MGDLASTLKTDLPIAKPVPNPEGCPHYKRKCKLVSPCCSKVYPCRICHDDEEDHEMNRKDVKEVVCTQCKLRQAVGLQCKDCEAIFGNYTCLICNLFDDEDKNQFHCDGCEICRIGGRDKFFHCTKCNMCLPKQIENDHKCIENVSHANCPVCLEDIHTSRLPSHIPKCGHLLHRVCFDQLVHSGLYACPVCQISLLDMRKLWEHLDEDIANSPMPSKYNNIMADILCKDCQTKCTVKFHMLGRKCSNCGSYNTYRIKIERRIETSESSNDQNEGEDIEDNVMFRHVLAEEEETVQGGEEAIVQGGEEETIQGGEEAIVQRGEEDTVQMGEEETVQGGDEAIVQGGEKASCDH